MRTNSFIPGFMAAACIVTSPLPAKNPPRIQPAESVEVIVSVTQVGLVPREVQTIAEETARLLFLQIGVNLRFTDDSPQADTEAIALHIWERAPDGLDGKVMGSARIGDRRVRQASAFYSRVAEFSGKWDPREHGVLLGYAIAHEIGHVLRAEPSHARSGVMKSGWNQQDTISMLQGFVRFNKADAERIFEVMAERRLVLGGAR